MSSDHFEVRSVTTHLVTSSGVGPRLSDLAAAKAACRPCAPPRRVQNIQSTNWQTMRFKPPPPNSPIGWRVEFRSMEVQLTDFENAAFTVFIGLLTRAILSFNLNLYLPISKVRLRGAHARVRTGLCAHTVWQRAEAAMRVQVDENLKTAHKRDAARTELFYFRDNIFPPGTGPP